MKTWYKVSIELDDGMIYQIYVEGIDGEEDLILDFHYQKHWEQQPDISKYSVTVANNVMNSIQKIIHEYYKDEISFCLAMNALDYVESYN